MIRRILVATGVLAALLAAAFATPTVFGTSMGAPVPKVTGSVRLASPQQYASFNAFDYGTPALDRGEVKYTNFEYSAAGTGVWMLAANMTLTVTLGGNYPHTMYIDQVTAQSTTSTSFTGHGFYNPDPAYTWTVTGSVTGANVSFDIVYTGTSAGYAFHAIGTIAANGSMSGTATDSLSQSPLTWATNAGSAHEVLSFTTKVTCVVITAPDASFWFTIPAGFPGLSGLSVLVKVHDGGTPGTAGDTWAHGVSAPCVDGPVNPYPITAGNLVVHA